MQKATLTFPDGRKAEVTISDLVFPEEEWPLLGDEFYYINSNGDIIKDRYGDIDKNKKDIGNSFKTEKEAKKEMDFKKSLTTVKKYILKNFAWSDELEYSNVKYFHVSEDFQHGLFCNFRQGQVKDCWPLPYLLYEKDVDELIKKFPNELKTIINYKF